MLCAFLSNIAKISAQYGKANIYDELIQIWDQCRIPVKSKRDIIDKIEKLQATTSAFEKQAAKQSVRNEKSGSVLNQTRWIVWYSSCSRKLFNSLWRGQAIPGSAADKSFWEYRGDKFLTTKARRAVGRKRHIVNCYNPLHQNRSSPARKLIQIPIRLLLKTRVMMRHSHTIQLQPRNSKSSVTSSEDSSTKLLGVPKLLLGTGK